MKIIKQSHYIETPINGEEILKYIEKCTRIAYKSEHKITDYENTKKFVKSIIDREHLSTIEHFSVSVRFILPRHLSHELVRHRIASFTQECVSGDTKVTKKYSIKDLYKRSIGTCYDKTHNKTLYLKSVDKNGKIIPNKFNEVFYKGIQPVYEIITKYGYSIKCTLKHKFKNEFGNFIELENLKIGDKIYINGRPCVLKISDEKLIKHYLDEKLNVNEIAELYSVKPRGIYRRLNKLGVFVNHLNDKNKEKYNKNNTNKSHEKMRLTIINQYKNGRIVWNKGLTEFSCDSMKRVADNIRKYCYRNLPGEKNSNWKGGISYNYYASKKKEVKSCEICGVYDKHLEIHHIDKNRKNNLLNNLIKCCINCHNIFHHDWYVGIKELKDTIISINYIGNEEVYDLEMKDPYNNYVANGFVVHNSTRYCSYDKEKFGNEITVIDPFIPSIKDKDNKDEKEQKAYNVWYEASEHAEKSYMKLLDIGYPAQIARGILPLDLKTEIVVTANLREWIHILKLRTSKGAHPQMRELMIPLLNEFKEKIPIIFDNILI